MFVKLLKHDWRANRGLIGLLCAIIAVSGLLTGGILRYMTWSAAMGNEFMVAVYAVVLAVAVVLVLGCCLGATYLLAYRFYQSRFSDQGYLTLTLPVTAHQQLLSGLVHITGGVLLVALTACLSVAMSLWIFFSAFDSATVDELLRILEEARIRISVTSGISEGLGFLAALKMVLAFPEDIAVLMLAMTVGAQAHKYPVLKGVAVYMGTDILLTEGLALLGALTGNEMLTVAVSCVAYAAVGVGAYFLNHRIFQRKLNLV